MHTQQLIPQGWLDVRKVRRPVASSARSSDALAQATATCTQLPRTATTATNLATRVAVCRQGSRQEQVRCTASHLNLPTRQHRHERLHFGRLIALWTKEVQAQPEAAALLACLLAAVGRHVQCMGRAAPALHVRTKVPLKVLPRNGEGSWEGGQWAQGMLLHRASSSLCG